MQMRVFYFRYDQDYQDWDLWLWPKGGEGAAYPFSETMPLPDQPEYLLRYADIQLPEPPPPEWGLIVRHNGWESRDWDSDRYVNLVAFPAGDRPEIYLVQHTEQIFLELGRISFIPSAERAFFRNFREIHAVLQAPLPAGGEGRFLVMGNGIPKRVRRAESVDNRRNWLIELEEDWNIGETCMVFPAGFEPFPVQYGPLYDTLGFERLYAYEADDLGCFPTPEETHFRVWSPTASRVELRLFRGDQDAFPERTLPLIPDRNGTWVLSLPEDLNGWHYTYLVTNGSVLQEVCDPQAVCVGLNGKRALVMRPADENPPGWDEIGHIVPVNPTDAVLYEVHIRDYTIHPDSGIRHKGKFLGLTESGTRTPDGTATGLDHLEALGITHVHLMPVFDFYTIDESRLHEKHFNWGYDPHLYNVPEGSYTLNPENGPGRVREFKQMVLALKQRGIGVVMDVVYNHTYRSIDSEFNKLVPGYYYRTDDRGRFSNGSGCGNETASERRMVRKAIIDSVLYWAREYKIDGFRFDLMGLHDIETMNEIRRALDRHHPGLLMYGEGWVGGPSMLNPAEAALKQNAIRLLRIGCFNDDARDAIKGDNFLAESGGFINGRPQARDGVKLGITGAIAHPGVDLFRATGGSGAWAGYPWHCVNYAASHDNLTLYDKLVASGYAATAEEAIQRTQLAGVLVLLSQGIPFMLSGTEFLRSKQGMHNSYNAPDSINQIDWRNKSMHESCFAYHRGLIQLRLSHPAFRMTSPEDIRRSLTFLNSPPNVIAYLLRSEVTGVWPFIAVIVNTGRSPEQIRLSHSAEWNVVADSHTAGCETLCTVTGNLITVPGLGALIAWASK